MTNQTRRLGGALSITLLADRARRVRQLHAVGVRRAHGRGDTRSRIDGAGRLTTSAAAAATPASSLATTGRIVVADKGFALTLPDGWTRVDITPEALEAAMAASELDPALAAQYEAQIKSLLGTGLSIFAFGPDPSKGTQVTVLALPGMGLSLDLLDQINQSQLESLAEGDIVSERVTLPAGDAIHYRYALGVEGTGGRHARPVLHPRRPEPARRHRHECQPGGRHGDRELGGSPRLGGNAAVELDPGRLAVLREGRLRLERR